MHVPLREDGRLFKIDLRIQPRKVSSQQQLALATSSDNTEKWHRRLGHLNEASMKTLRSKPGSGVKFQDALQPCKTCKLGKSAQQNHPKTSTVTTTLPFELVYTDLAGPFKPQAKDGSRYISKFSDHHTRWKAAYPIASKDKALDTLIYFIQDYVITTGNRIQRLRCDKGGEYMADYYRNYCKETGIQMEFAATNTPQQNGVSERDGRTILNMERYGNKLEEKAWEGVMLGYGKDSKSYRIYNPHNRRITESRNVTFIETPHRSLKNADQDELYSNNGEEDETDEDYRQDVLAHLPFLDAETDSKAKKKDEDKHEPRPPYYEGSPSSAPSIESGGEVESPASPNSGGSPHDGFSQPDDNDSGRQEESYEQHDSGQASSDVGAPLDPAQEEDEEGDTPAGQEDQQAYEVPSLLTLTLTLTQLAAEDAATSREYQLINVSKLSAIAKYPFPTDADRAVFFVDLLKTLDYTLGEILVRADKSGKTIFESTRWPPGWLKPLQKAFLLSLPSGGTPVTRSISHLFSQAEAQLKTASGPSVYAGFKKTLCSQLDIEESGHSMKLLQEFGVPTKTTFEKYLPKLEICILTAQAMEGTNTQPSRAPGAPPTSSAPLFFWKPPHPLSNWTMSKMVVNEVSYNCNEQYITAAKARLFGDSHALTKIMTSPDPRTHKSLGRSVANFDQAIWEFERQNICLTECFAKFLQNPALRTFLLNTGDRLLAEASPSDKIWGIGLRADNSAAKHPHRWPGLNLLGHSLMTTRSLLRNAPTLAVPDYSILPSAPNPDSSIHELVEPSTEPSAFPVSEQSDDPARACFAAAPADHPADALHVATVRPVDSSSAAQPYLAEFGPDLVGGTISIEDDSYTTKARIFSGATATSAMEVRTLLDSGSPCSFITASALKRLIASGSATKSCEVAGSPRNWGGFGASNALRTNTSIRLSVQFQHGSVPTASLAVWACVVPDGTMKDPLLLGRDSFHRFSQQLYQGPRNFSGYKSNIGELTLSHLSDQQVPLYIEDHEADPDQFHLHFAGDTSVSLSATPTLVDVNLIRNIGTPALTGNNMVKLLPQEDSRSPATEVFVSHGRQQVPIVGCGEIRPGALLGTAASPLLQAPPDIFDNLEQDHPEHPEHPDTTGDESCVNTVHDNVPVAEDEDEPPTEPPADLLARLDEHQRASFLDLWSRIPKHLRHIVFDLHGPGWSPEVITQLADLLCEFPSVFSASKTDFGRCSLLPFEIHVPPGQKPISTPPYSMNPIVARKVDVILDKYIASGLIQLSTSPWRSPLVVIPKKNGDLRVTVNYKKLNAVSELGQQPLPRVDATFDKLRSAKIFSLFDLTSSFHQIVNDKDTIPLTAFCTPTRLLEWLVMPQGASQSPGWYMRVINEVIQNLERVLAYLDDVIVHDTDPASHIANLRLFFERLVLHNLKLSPSKTRIGATEADFLGHTICPDGVRPMADKVVALTNMPMPKDIKQLRSLLGGLSYYRKYLPNMSKRIKPIQSLMKKNAKYIIFTPEMEKIVRELLDELSHPPTLVFPDWDAVADGSRVFLLFCDASIDGFGASLEQEQPDGSVKPIVYISRATLPSERNWTPLDLEAGSIVWAIKRLRGYLWMNKFRIFTDHQALENIGKVGDHNARVQRWVEFLTAYDNTLEYRKGSANGNADFLSRLPQPATEADRTGPGAINDPDTVGVYIIRSLGLTEATYDYFGPLPLTPRGNRYILLFTDRFSRRADMFPVTQAQFTAEGTADILTDWDLQLPHVEAAYNNSENAATGLTPNDVHIGRTPRLPLSLFTSPNIGGHQSLDRDHLAYCDLATERQRRAYTIVRDHYAITASRLESRNSKLLAAFKRPLYEPLKIPPTTVLSTTSSFFLDLPSDMPGSDAKPRVSVARCKPCHNPTDTSEVPNYLPADLSLYALNSFAKKSPPYHVTTADVFSQPTRLDVEQLTAHQVARGRGGNLAVMYETHWKRLLTPSWERESDLQHFRPKILQYWSGAPAQRRQTNRLYRQMRVGSAQPEIARSKGVRFLAEGYALVPHHLWTRRFRVSTLPTGAYFWYKSSDNLWWLGKISRSIDVSPSTPAANRYIVRFLDDSGPIALTLSPTLYSIALGAPSGSWCLQCHRQPGVTRGVLRNADTSRGAPTTT
eukprot:g13940.t1